MKAQASLEMIVGFLVLLVVASVVIGLVIYFISPSQMPRRVNTEIDQFKAECEDYCKRNDLVEYCKAYYFGDNWDGDNFFHEIVEVGKYDWDTCEDRVYCFLAEPCDKFGVGVELLENCKRLLCQTYLEKRRDPEMATKELFEAINFPDECDVSSISPDDNWYEEFFAEGCGETSHRMFIIVE